MLPLRTRAWRAGTILHRIHRLIHDPVFFGPPGPAPLQRYDDPAGSYNLARRIETAFGKGYVEP
jgi:hypothetical protein